jgi:hypothetical protein
MLQSECKACHREGTQRDYRYNKEDVIMRVLEWQIDNAEKVRAYKRKYKEYEKKQRQINRARKENSSGDS